MKRINPRIIHPDTNKLAGLGVRKGGGLFTKVFQEFSLKQRKDND